MNRAVRASLTLPLALLCLAATGGGFDGCGGSSPPVGRPLPRSTELACFEDADCELDTCAEVRCVAGACTEVAPIRDADGDGHAPMPCGMDCDDADNRVHPGVAEQCNAIDDDCDASVDEEARPAAIRRELATVDPLMTMCSWGDHVLVTDAGFGRGLRVREVRSLAIGLPTPVLDTGDVDAVALATRPGGAWLAVHAAGARVVVIALDEGPDGSPLVGTSVEVPMSELAVSVAIESVGSSFAVAWDDEDETRRRAVWMPGWADPVALVASTGEGLDVATDGTDVVVITEEAVVFLSAADGSQRVRHETGTRVAEAPLASDAGSVVVAVVDSFDRSLVRATRDALSAPTAVPFEDMTRALRVDVIDGVVAVLRPSVGASSTPGVALSLLDATFREEDSFTAAQISGDPRARELMTFGLASTAEGMVVMSNWGRGGSTFTLLACRE